MTGSTSLSRLRRLLVVASASLAAQAGVLIALVLTAPALESATVKPVDFEGMILVGVNVRVGTIVLLGLVALSWGLLASRTFFGPYSQRLNNNNHSARWVLFSLSSSITVFLVAQLNGITDVGTLVLIYAATSAMTLFSVLQERLPASTPANMLPLSFGAAIGIVPWGIIAFHEIASTIVGDGPSAAVRVITLLMLASAFAFAISQWREQRRGSAGLGDTVGERTSIVLSTVSSSVFAWAVFVATS